jgi:hypothetical protein
MHFGCGIVERQTQELIHKGTGQQLLEHSA